MTTDDADAIRFLASKGMRPDAIAVALNLDENDVRRALDSDIAGNTRDNEPPPEAA